MREEESNCHDQAYTRYSSVVAHFSDRNILNRTLEDGGFWYENGAMKPRERVVWLLLYDMQGRKFARRRDGGALEIRENIFKVRHRIAIATFSPSRSRTRHGFLLTLFQFVGLKDIEDALLQAKTHLAASISRLRIGGSAFSLGYF